MRYLFLTLTAYLMACLTLSACQQTNTNPKSYEGRDGNFTAILMPIDVKDVVEFDKPSNQGPKLVLKNQAIVGDKVALKIVFMGMELTKDMQGDVSYDLVVLAPDGSIYPGTDIKNISALEGKVSTPHNVFNSPATMVLNFEPEDQIGTYKVTTTVKDNIGKRQVLLEHDIELQKAQ